MVCPSVFEVIGSFLESKDQARLAATCYAAREGCSQLPHVKVSFADDTSLDTLRSFAKWLMTKASHLETLVIKANMYQWSLVWRYLRVETPKLHTVHLSHTGKETLLLPGPEEVMPACPALKTLILEAHSLHMGMGFSRLFITRLEIRTATLLTANVMAFAFPALEALVVKTNVFDTLCFVYGLHNYKHLKYLECPVSMLHIAANLPELQCLVVHWMSGIPTQRLRGLRMSSKVLSWIRLVGGSWTDLQWIPESVNMIECLGCVLHAPLPLKHLEHLALVGCIADEYVIEDVNVKHLHVKNHLGV